jgi:hypothetical protein
MLTVTHLLVYPETKGVPLEEMDRVFGEGQSFCVYTRKDLIYPMSTDEREEALENESEITSLIPNSPRRARQSLSPQRKDPPGRAWVNRMFGGVNSRPLYEPIADSEE